MKTAASYFLNRKSYSHDNEYNENYITTGFE